MPRLSPLYSWLAFSALLLEVQACALPQDPDHASVGETIVGGVDARDPHPWLAALHMRNLRGEFEHYCGGSQIEASWVLTAAHCLSEGGEPLPAEELRVSLGVTSPAELQAGDYRKAKRVILHPLYRDAGGQPENDLALIELETPRPLDSYPPRLSAWMERQKLRVGTLVRALGWGLTREDALQPPKTLQQVDLPWVSREACKQAYPGAIRASMACAGWPQGGRDTCQGDSGGPLVLLESPRLPRLVGITSWGEGCGRAGKYGVYTRLSRFSAWLSRCTESGQCDP